MDNADDLSTVFGMLEKRLKAQAERPLTAEAMGVPMPCIPAPVGPWVPGSLVQSVTELPVLTNDSVCMCGLGGVITFVEPGQITEETI